MLIIFFMLCEKKEKEKEKLNPKQRNNLRNAKQKKIKRQKNKISFTVRILTQCKCFVFHNTILYSTNYLYLFIQIKIHTIQ